MRRIVALVAVVAVIALGMMSIGMALTLSPAMAMVTGAPRSMAAHMPAQAAPLAAHHRAMKGCTDGVQATCELCCVVAPPLAPLLRSAARARGGFLAMPMAPQIGLATPPALPPPRWDAHFA